MSESAVWLHHFGCLVRQMDELPGAYAPLLGPKAAPAPIRIPSQKVQVCFLPLATGIFLELVQPDADNAFLNRLLNKGVSFYHLGFYCRNLRAKEAELLQAGAKFLVRFASEAFEGRECVFLLTANDQMVELIQAPETLNA